MKYNLVYKQFGEYSILIEWPQRIDTCILYDILGFKLHIAQSEQFALNYINHAYAALFLSFELKNFNFLTIVSQLKNMYQQSQKLPQTNCSTWNIPVCYDKSFGIDLDSIAKQKQMTPETLVKLHTAPVYTVFFIGFLPGFLYLGGLHTSLSTPRKATPRSKVLQGAVAIGGSQTGIYPTECPGGWQIIGNTPIRFFDRVKPSPCFAKAGDVLKFYGVSLEEHRAIAAAVITGNYIIQQG